MAIGAPVTGLTELLSMPADAAVLYLVDLAEPIAADQSKKLKVGTLLGGVRADITQATADAGAAQVDADAAQVDATQALADVAAIVAAGYWRSVGDGQVTITTTSEGIAVRFPNKIQLATCKFDFGAVNVAFGNVFISTLTAGAAWPAPFFTPPVVASHSVRAGGNQPTHFASGTSGPTATHAPAGWGVAFVSNAAGGTVSFLALGIWD